MDIRILLEVLDTRQNQYKYTGPMEGQVYGVQVQNGSYSYLEGMLYVQPSLTHPRPPKNTCVIAGETDLYEVGAVTRVWKSFFNLSNTYFPVLRSVTYC